MTIAKNWIESSVNVEGRQDCLPTFPTSSHSSFAGEIRRFLPSRRDREVPYGMKGGELNGHEEEGTC